MKKPESNNSEKKKIREKTIYIVGAIVLLVAAIVLICMIVLRQKGIDDQLSQMEKLKEETIAEEVEEESALEEIPEDEIEYISDDLSNYDVPDIHVSFNSLYAVNPDIFAWINIPGTNVDYPILQHPTDIDYYLKHNIDGSEGYPGCIYTQYYNSTEMTSYNTIIYGHNMKDGSMFHTLHNYEDEDFLKDNPYVYIYTPTGIIVYEIFASAEYSDKHILAEYDFTKDTDKEAFVQEIKSLDGAVINETVEVNNDSHLITMSTCVSPSSTKRYIVVAAMVADGRPHIAE